MPAVRSSPRKRTIKTEVTTVAEVTTPITQTFKVTKKTTTTTITTKPKAKKVAVRDPTPDLSQFPHSHKHISQQTQYDEVMDFLSKRDPKLAALIAKTPCRPLVPGEARSENNYFKALARSIIYQQLSGKAAASIYRKFVKLFFDNDDEENFPTAQQVKDTPAARLREGGLSVRKGEYLVELASRFADGSISDAKLDGATDAEIDEMLTSVRGIGQWTVDMFKIFTLKRPNVLPVGDLAVRKGMAMHFGISGKTTTSKSSSSSNSKVSKIYLPTPEEMFQHAEVWQPYRTVGSFYMWRVQDTKLMDEEDE
ncbi:hypothetical protein SmJEL517_g04434 [Synchytrium microbalum]|uniref:HhH-GPD domain-containing protein n=1 Tax=Synchytrium microbalum TaxID=1806994 RepID=A0A507C049_9FUNG|nr:uncharacterized protein SmJEL517_g04434 [Synchytrium microbalum]TPX32439.1 hypothetical protein SmJEL517_g04434 [Synchytrium microbalum]